MYLPRAMLIGQARRPRSHKSYGILSQCRDVGRHTDVPETVLEDAANVAGALLQLPRAQARVQR
eukprot:COSAG01_NODE_49931_length_368_cov_0.531599_2_plen_63_part_01